MPINRDEGLEGSTVILEEETFARLCVGEEHPPGESPCLGCGAYYFTLHATGCEYEQCPRCGGQLETCGCR
jgi:hypothetical protein